MLQPLSSRLVYDEPGVTQLPHSCTRYRYWSIGTSLDFSAPYLSLTEHPASAIPMTPFSTVDPGMMVLAAGLWVNVGIVMSAKDAMVNTTLTNCTFQAYKGSQRSRSLGENAVGVNNKVALQITAPSWVNSVSSSLTVPCSTFALTGVDSQKKIGLPRISCSFDDSCSSALALSLHQPLLPSYKVSSIRVEKLNKEMLTHPDQSLVTYVLDGLQNGFRVGFDLASVS